MAQSSGSVTAQRKMDATSGISGLAGKVNVGGLNPLLSLSSSNNLQGKGQAATQSSLRSAIAGRVAAVYPNGTLVVEAQRQVTMNNEKQTVILRGLVRPGDVASDNSVLSTSIGNLELELKGKGVISDSTRPPNPSFAPFCGWWGSDMRAITLQFAIYANAPLAVAGCAGQGTPGPVARRHLD